MTLFSSEGRLAVLLLQEAESPLRLQGLTLAPTLPAEGSNSREDSACKRMGLPVSATLPAPVGVSGASTSPASRIEPGT